jgi:hypothetical protein
MPSGVRFWPPNAALNPGIHWGLLRAFGDSDNSPLIHLADPYEALSQARRLGLLLRIVTRCPKQLLAAELSPPVLEQESRQIQTLAARGLALEHTLQTLDQQAASLKARFALIKGSAIARHAGLPLSLRGACDVDILSEQSGAERLHSAMKRRGYTEKTPTHPDYHLPMLVNDSGGALEIHTAVPYVSLSPCHAEVTLQQLLDSDLARPAPRMSAYAYVPKPEFLLAHCLAHGIAQHGYIPRSYPLLRMLGDAIDLGLGGETGLNHEPMKLISSFVSQTEYVALRDLAVTLTRGDVESAWTDPGPTGRMLRHMTMGSLDEAYANGLKLFQAAHIMRTLGIRAFVRGYARATFGLANEDLARIYGERAQGREIKYKLARPLDVTARILRMVPDASRAVLRRITK